tara:strand:- start:84 stop:287 length:204 start_codon:yes stop_codon:yes gene_type:complete
MKNIIAILTIMFLFSACSSVNDSVTFGKKCMVKDDKVVYSYIWLYNKTSGLSADPEQCKEIAPKPKK